MHVNVYMCVYRDVLRTLYAFAKLNGLMIQTILCNHWHKYSLVIIAHTQHAVMYILWEKIFL